MDSASEAEASAAEGAPDTPADSRNVCTVARRLDGNDELGNGDRILLNSPDGNPIMSEPSLQSTSAKTEMENQTDPVEIPDRALQPSHSNQGNIEGEPSADEGVRQLEMETASEADASAAKDAPSAPADSANKCTGESN
ncbi:hypothetical protein SRHO_G00258030 [Serrasalmus rhombeus]